MAQEKEGHAVNCTACGCRCPDKQESAPRISQVARDFQKNALAQDLLTVPGIGQAAIKALKSRDVMCTDQLLAVYFSLGRNVKDFEVWLVNAGLQTRFARDCAENVHRKLGAL